MAIAAHLGELRFNNTAVSIILQTAFGLLMMTPIISGVLTYQMAALKFQTLPAAACGIAAALLHAFILAWVVILIGCGLHNNCF